MKPVELDPAYASSAFFAWVKRHGIGPGMSDRYDDLHYSGFDGWVGRGWVEQILEPLAVDLKALGWSGRVRQIKEKFGTLRFYVDADDTKIRARIAVAAAASANVCEDCGQAGARVTVAGWVRALCRACAVIATHRDRVARWKEGR